MAHDNEGELGGGIKVSVAPSQSAYFAGESFSVLISFTNTHKHDALYASAAKPALFTPSHRRSAHSISSAPLAKPPTSPGGQKLFFPTSTATADIPFTRRGRIGTKTWAAPAGVRKKGHSGKSMSVQVTPQDLINRLADDTPKNQSPLRHVITPPAGPSSPRSAAPVPRSHPHARKNSVHDEKLQDLAGSSFAGSLDPISESGSPRPTTPSGTSPMPPEIYVPSEKNAHYRRNSATDILYNLGVGLGIGFPSTSQPPPKNPSTFNFSPPGTEVLLWSYAQLTGAVEIDDSLVRYGAIGDLRAKLRKGGIVGGGIMDAASMPSTRPRPSGYFSAFRSPPLPSPAPRRGHRHTPSLLNGIFPTPLSGTASAAEAEHNLPTLELQPSMLGVDVSLAPGETRTYTYRVQLPPTLPPTFRGRALNFSYNLVVGTCRGPAGAGPERQQSRVMRIPIRIYNNVSVGIPQRPYDLMWPIARRREPPPDVSVLEETAKKIANGQTVHSLASHGSSEEVQAYATRLLAIRSSEGADSLALSQDEFLERGETSGCRESVEILTRNSKKASYDVSKDGDRVGVLTFVKSSYRLGETVLGVVELNKRTDQARVLKFTAILEAHELLPTVLQDGSKPKSLLRRVHAEHYGSLLPDTCRTTFALDIPSDASPGFQLGSNGTAEGGLEWRVRICFLVSIGRSEIRHMIRDGAGGEWGSSWQATEGVAPLGRLPRRSRGDLPSTWGAFFSAAFLGSGGDEDDGEGGDSEEEWEELSVQTVECEVPIKVLPGNTAYTAASIVYEV